jgi:4-carboxymuconolactone decarboxylase
MFSEDMSMSLEQRLNRGEQARREVLGDEHVDRMKGAESAHARLFQQFITGAAWADVWARPGLDRATRSLVTIALLAGGGNIAELELHMRAAASAGVTAAEVAEALLHVAVYQGFPQANAAFRCLDRVYGPDPAE